jgi:hypothetical protein
MEASSMMISRTESKYAARGVSPPIGDIKDIFLPFIDTPAKERIASLCAWILHGCNASGSAYETPNVPPLLF